MVDQPKEKQGIRSAAQRRDVLLLNLLKTPPQPRPKRERSKKKPTRTRTSRASGEKARAICLGVTGFTRPQLATALRGRYGLSRSAASRLLRFLNDPPRHCASRCWCLDTVQELTVGRVFVPRAKVRFHADFVRFTLGTGHAEGGA
jgi:hypothetical protein